MKFKAEIDVMPLEALLDPQGKAVTNSMKNIGLDMIDGVRIGGLGEWTDHLQSADRVVQFR